MDSNLRDMLARLNKGYEKVLSDSKGFGDVSKMAKEAQEKDLQETVPNINEKKPENK